jgi:hypothetical protein
MEEFAEFWRSLGADVPNRTVPKAVIAQNGFSIIENWRMSRENQKSHKPTTSLKIA